jgi:hypothetical protein
MNALIVAAKNAAKEARALIAAARAKKRIHAYTNVVDRCGLCRMAFDQAPHYIPTGG